MCDASSSPRGFLMRPSKSLPSATCAAPATATACITWATTSSSVTSFFFDTNGAWKLMPTTPPLAAIARS